MNRFLPLILAFFIFFQPLMPSTASDDRATGPSGDNARKEGGRLNPGIQLISFYRRHLSAVDGDRCPSLPTCSTYCLKAVKKHGFVIGWMMTVDRLIHEGKEETAVSPVVLSEGKWRIYDPVENNDFWWHPQKGENHE